MMSDFAFIVDGHLEKKFIQQICPNKPVRMINCNGRTVSSTSMAKRIASHCRLLKGRYYPIIIWVDLEDRNMTFSEFSYELLDAIRKEGTNDEIIIGVADRAIENWILADKRVVSNFAKTSCQYPACSDGFNGKSKIKKILDSYHETTTGVELLVKCNPSRMIVSPSFKEFFEKLPKDQCWWLQR